MFKIFRDIKLSVGSREIATNKGYTCSLENNDMRGNLKRLNFGTLHSLVSGLEASKKKEKLLVFVEKEMY